MDAISDEYRRIGIALKEARERRGMHQSEIGRQIGRTKGSVSMIEKGTTRAPIDLLMRYGQFVGVDIAVLVDNTAQQKLAMRLARLPGLSPEAEASLSALLSVWEAQHSTASIAG